VLAVSVGLMTMSVSVAQAEGPPPHGHALLTGVTVGMVEGIPFPVPVDYQKCRLLAGGKELPLHAHHAGIHTGEKQRAAMDRAGNFVVPLYPLTDFTSCDDIAEFVYGGAG
jgi:hypothetical protein